MACCGSGRRAISANGIPIGKRLTEPVLFECRSSGPLTIFGRITGIRYHFPGPGARSRVDWRDAPTLEIVRGLEVVGGAPKQ